MNKDFRKVALSTYYQDIEILDSDVNHVVSKPILKEPPVLIAHDAADDVIYAANPITGVPSPLAHVNRSMLTDPSIAITLQMRDGGAASVNGCSDENVAIEMLKKRFETQDEYAERLRNIVKSNLTDDEED